MSTTATKTWYTPENLLTMPDGDFYELVDGELVELKMGGRSSYVGGTIFRLLSVFCHTHRLGWMFPGDTSFQCYPDDPGKVRRPDGAFIRLGRLPNEEVPEGHIRVAPDLVIEVISPRDTAYEVNTKLQEYLSAGVQLVWIVYPVSQEVHIHRVNGTVTVLRRGDEELSGEDVLPGFHCRVEELFAYPKPVDETGSSNVASS